MARSADSYRANKIAPRTAANLRKHPDALRVQQIKAQALEHGRDLHVAGRGIVVEAPAAEVHVAQRVKDIAERHVAHVMQDMEAMEDAAKAKRDAYNAKRRAKRAAVKATKD